MRSKGKPVVVLAKWRGRVKEAKKRGRFTRAEKKMAAGWAYCAVGERSDILGIPVAGSLNDDLITSGARFCGAVADDEFAQALTLIRKIERAPVEARR